MASSLLARWWPFDGAVMLDGENSRAAVERVSFVCISDTHGQHRDLEIPEADILIHAGDLTRHGKEEDAVDFNAWLGELPHVHKVVINGNHESNAPWAAEASKVLSNATHLVDSAVTLRVRHADVKIHGCQFYWPMKTSNPNYDEIVGADVIICHSPTKGVVDGGRGCETLKATVRRVRPRLVVSGHIHGAHGVQKKSGTTYVNAANCRRSHAIGWPAETLQLTFPTSAGPPLR